MTRLCKQQLPLPFLLHIVNGQSGISHQQILDKYWLFNEAGSASGIPCHEIGRLCVWIRDKKVGVSRNNIHVIPWPVHAME